METALLLAALLFKLVGVVFIFGAALGLIRFRDPFQRMHAATKAGTVGAIFTDSGRTGREPMASRRVDSRSSAFLALPLASAASA